MYRFSRAIYRELADEIVEMPHCVNPHVHHERVLRACEAAIERLATDRRYFAHPARTLFKAMDGKGSLVILEGPPTLPTAGNRLRGFRDALKDFPNIKVMMSKNANYARPVALDLFKTMLKLSNPPPVDGVLAANDAMAFGVVEAYKEAKKKIPPVVGINGSKEAVDFIKAGEMLASGDYNGLIDGCLGAEIAIRALRKEDFPKEIMAKTSVVHKDNAQDYDIPVEKRICPTLASRTAK